MAGVGRDSKPVSPLLLADVASWDSLACGTWLGWGVTGVSDTAEG